MKKYTAFSIQNHLFVRLSMFLVIIVIQSVAISAQCNCSNIVQDQPICQQEKILEFDNGTNITNALKTAILENCRVIISNVNALSTSSGSPGNITFYISPTTFSNIQDKEIILEQGVTLLGILGGYSDCSQSIFTFEGSNVKNIIIRGDYDECLEGAKPTIKASKPDLYNIGSDLGYLVASDNDGEPYLDDNGNPNFVFSDGDQNPYHNDNGKPNLITSNQPKVEVSCDYNDFICNRDIVVWCPFSLEGRHLISIQGTDNITIEDIVLSRSAGGDGIHITDDRDFIPAQAVKIKQVDLVQNARTGVVVANSKCSTIDSSSFTENGKYIPEANLERRGAIAFHQNSNFGSITPYLGKLPRWTQRANSVVNSTFSNNKGHEFSFDLPLLINHCGNINISAIDNCVTETTDVIAFKSLSKNQYGQIRFTNFTVYDYLSTMISVDNDWFNTSIDHRFVNVTSNAALGQQNVYQINNQSFCQNLFVADWCQTNTTDLLCGQTYSCNNDQNYVCLSEYICCDFTPTIETVIDTICECDFLFLVDESSSVDSAEWIDMECTIFDIMSDLNSNCEDVSVCYDEKTKSYDQECIDEINARVRFALVQWSSKGDQFIYSDFVDDPFHFTRTFENQTALFEALSFVNTSINTGALTPKTRFPTTNSSKCLKTIILSDADCNQFEDDTQAEALVLNTESFSPIDIVDYTFNSNYPNCDEVIATAIDGSIYVAEFDCGESGISFDDFIIYDTTHSISLNLDFCSVANVNWTVSNDGEILYSNPDSTSITVINSGSYSAVYFCETACNDTLFSVFDIDSLPISNLNSIAGESILSHKNREKLIDGKWYTPSERELLETSSLVVSSNTPIALYPNPSEGRIIFENPFIEHSGKYEIIDLKGRLITYGDLTADQKEVEINFTNAPQGILVLKLIRGTDGFINYTRFVNHN